MARQVVVYDDFTGGEWGNLGPYEAKNNMWSGSNMLVYRTGELGVRPGLKNMTPSGPAPAAGVVHGFGCQGVPGGDIWYIQGTATRSFGTDTGVGGSALNTLTGALAEIPTSPVDVTTDTNQTIIASYTDKLYRINTVADTVTALTGSPGLRCVCLYGSFVVGGDVDGSLDNRLRFSDDANPNSWTATNFIDFGDNWSIHAVFPQRQHLLVMKQAGNHIMTGFPGVNSVTRAQLNGPGVYHPLHAAIGPDDVVAYLPGDNTFPILHNGSTYKQMEHLDNHLVVGHSGDSFPPSHGVAQCNGINRGFYFFQTSGNKMIAYHNKVWSYHTFGVNISGYVSKQGHGSRVYICDGGAVGTAPKFYWWNPLVDTPGGITGETRPGDDSNTLLTGNFSLPEYWDKSGDEFYVRSVIVDFKTWNTGADNTNHFDLYVQAKNLYQQSATVDSNTVSFDSAQASSSSSGTERRQIFGFGEQGMGNGYQLHLTNIRGVAIKRITVVLDVRPVRA